MRYTASEKLESIELVERSGLSVRRTLAPLGIPRSTFYGWYRRYAEGGVEALADRFHVSEGHRLGVVVSVHGARR